MTVKIKLTLMTLIGNKVLCHDSTFMVENQL